MSRLLVVSEDIVSREMAGPAIRCVEIAKALSKSHEVTLAVPKEPEISIFDVKTIVYKGNLEDLIRKNDTVLISGYLASKYPVFKNANRPLVVDIYDPFVLENLEIHREESLGQRIQTHFFDLSVLNDLLKIGDYFICASEKQRDFWLGMLTALGRINPRTYDKDKSLRNLLDVVPFGIPSRPPAHNKEVLKGVYKNVGKDDKVILWGGGIWNWFDPVTLLRAVKKITEKRTDIKLFFMGTKHPNPEIPQMRACLEAIKLSKELSLYNEYVFFNEWVPYEERENYLLEADIGVSAHLKHLETNFSFRTRVLDYIWAGLPIIATRGDFIAELITKEELGLAVDYGDAEGMAYSIEKLIDDSALRKRCSDNVGAVASKFAWEKVVKPLDKFCRNPIFAADKAEIAKVKEGSSFLRLTKRLFYYLRKEGVGSTAARVGQFSKRHRRL